MQPDDMLATPEYKRYAAEKLLVHARQMLARQMLDRGTVTQEYDYCLKGFIRTLETYVVGMPSERIVVHRKWPADWWQAFRERWFPKRWLERHPVKYEAVDIDRQLYAAVCPHVAIPGSQKHLEWMSLKWDALQSLE